MVDCPSIWLARRLPTVAVGLPHPSFTALLLVLGLPCFWFLFEFWLPRVSVPLVLIGCFWSRLPLVSLVSILFELPFLVLCSSCLVLTLLCGFDCSGYSFWPAKWFYCFLFQLYFCSSRIFVPVATYFFWLSLNYIDIQITRVSNCLVFQYSFNPIDLRSSCFEFRLTGVPVYFSSDCLSSSYF